MPSPNSKENKALLVKLSEAASDLKAALGLTAELQDHLELNQFSSQLNVLLSDPSGQELRAAFLRERYDNLRHVVNKLEVSIEPLKQDEWSAEMVSAYQKELADHRADPMHGTVSQPPPSLYISNEDYLNYLTNEGLRNTTKENARKGIVESESFKVLKAFIPQVKVAVEKELTYEKERLSEDAPILLSDLIARIEKIQNSVAEKIEEDKEKWYSFFPGATTDPARSQVIDNLLKKLRELQGDIVKPDANKPVLFKSALDAVSASIKEIRDSVFGANSTTANALEKVRTHINAYKEYENIKTSIRAPIKR
jgi:hypothetical protein